MSNFVGITSNFTLYYKHLTMPYTICNLNSSYLITLTPKLHEGNHSECLIGIKLILLSTYY